MDLPASRPLSGPGPEWPVLVEVVGWFWPTPPAGSLPGSPALRTLPCGPCLLLGKGSRPNVTIVHL